MDNEAAVVEVQQLRLEIDEYGTKRYYNNDNKRHREFGPAVEYADGTKMWFINGLLHRTDGPAVEYATTRKEWWLNGIRRTKEAFLKHPL